MVTPTFGEHLRRLRKVHGFAQTALAEKAEVSQYMISRYENGHELPSTPTVIRIARALGITTDELLEVWP